jgi:hypothetical protein
LVHPVIANRGLRGIAERPGPKRAEEELMLAGRLFGCC